MAAKAMSAFLVIVAVLLSFFSEVGADRPFPATSPISDHIDQTVTATKEMARDIVNSAAPKAGEAAQAIKDTAKSAIDSVAPTVNNAAESAKETTGVWASWFKHKLANLGIVHRGPAEPVKSSLSAPTKSPAPAPVKMSLTP